jgi:hypothetical protein
LHLEKNDMKLPMLLTSLLLLVACSGEDASSQGGAGGTAGTAAGGSAGASTSSTSSTSAGGSGGAGGSGAAGGGGAAGAPVGHPELFTESVFEMDFSQGTNGRYRGNGAAWQDFDSWDQAGVNGGWPNTDAVWVQTTDAVRTELLPNGLGAGRVLRTWIQAGDQWTTSATYPRTELTSSFTGDMPFGGEYRLELRFYAEGDLTSNGDSIIGLQLHHNGNTGSPPFELDLSDGALQFSIEDNPSGPSDTFPTFALQPDTPIEIVMELKFGYSADGAYVRMWVNGTQYVDVTNRNVGYPDAEPTAGYWKFCSLYDWGNHVDPSRSVFCGPTFRLSKRP